MGSDGFFRVWGRLKRLKIAVLKVGRILESDNFGYVQYG
ncbi:hypothetical protein MCC93_22740 [Morococcus cerebrosus]|uniref:Uncharacterized protein n=1 Tax=Morococcus cerebrosus TaxID=1056807 RepID=A0A0C1E3F1_9NEIS|nr:hypothetical protein MCC93_22740 [Morococcus cerebrosus]